MRRFRRETILRAAAVGSAGLLRSSLFFLLLFALFSAAAWTGRPAWGQSASPAAKAANGVAAKAVAAKSQNGYRTVVIKDVPHVQQKPDFCGEACAAMMLRRLGQDVDQDFVFDQSGLDPLAARGCFTKELAAALTRIGFRPGNVWNVVPAATGDAGVEAQWKALHADLSAGHASIICMRTTDTPEATEHFRLILGYDAATDEVIYHEPAEADGAYRRMPRSVLLRRWPLKYSAAQWTVIRMPLVPGRLVPGRVATTFTAADYCQHMMTLKKKIPGRGFTVVIQHPFVVLGDEPPVMVRRRAIQTVQWAVDKLKKSYFTKDPDQILDIWLFRDNESYEKHAEAIFQAKPSTPYGYFSHADGALVMNIATGGGTLVHEIVHPFVAANFPECPAWFNEGLGSLYEQSAESAGRIVGLTNWRLAGLQKALRDKTVPALKTLCSTTTDQFYNADPGTNYAQARYLCYYLQEKGLLEKYYREFHRRHATDPTGYETLQDVLGRPDMAAFEKQWTQYVLGLRFP